MLMGFHRECDRCGVVLTKENNKCGYELCDKCNEELEKQVRESKLEKTRKIEYKSDNGYTGVLYGESSFAVYDKDGYEVMHTGARSFNTYEELVEIVERMPEMMLMLAKHLEDMIMNCDEDADI